MKDMLHQRNQIRIYISIKQHLMDNRIWYWHLSVKAFTPTFIRRNEHLWIYVTEWYRRNIHNVLTRIIEPGQMAQMSYLIRYYAVWKCISLVFVGERFSSKRDQWYFFRFPMFVLVISSCPRWLQIRHFAYEGLNGFMLTIHCQSWYIAVKLLLITLLRRFFLKLDLNVKCAKSDTRIQSEYLNYMQNGNKWNAYAGCN